MKLNYDVVTDSLYIEFMDKAGSDAIVINDDMVLDIDETGKPVGLDIQHASDKMDLHSLEMQSFPVQNLKVKAG